MIGQKDLADATVPMETDGRGVAQAASHKVEGFGKAPIGRPLSHSPPHVCSGPEQSTTCSHR
jgi:hypothetical protein